MLRELRIENLLLIERAELRLAPGLNVITGETGAGKTILAHSLDLLTGGKARANLLRPGAEEAWVEGVFDLPGGLAETPELADLTERLPGGSEEVVLGRRVSGSGRTAAFIAGRTASAADLRLLGAKLLSFYGQHEHRKLTLASAQTEILDGFAGIEHMALRDAYRTEHRECIRLEAELAELREREGSRERDLDLLRFELAEIEGAGPDAEEERELEAELLRLRNAQSLREAAGEALDAVSGSPEREGASGLLAEATAALDGARAADPDLALLGERVGAAALELSDLGSELRGYLESVSEDAGRLAAVEERAAELDRLKRKHGGSIESVLEHAERCRAEVERLGAADERESGLEDELARASERRSRTAAKLSKGRAAAARSLEDEAAAELEALAMPDARLEVRLEPDPRGFGESGSELIEMRVATNPGLDPAPLRDAASGGELSRVMLALCGLGERSGAETLVFDEIDAGVGGLTANAVGQRLRDLGRSRQVLCITHLAQVASLAAAHFRIEKLVAAGRTSASVDRVEGDALVAEIARMLGGEGEGEAASRHAREMLAAA